MIPLKGSQKDDDYFYFEKVNGRYVISPIEASHERYKALYDSNGGQAPFSFKVIYYKNHSQGGFNTAACREQGRDIDYQLKCDNSTHYWNGRECVDPVTCGTNEMKLPSGQCIYCPTQQLNDAQDDCQYPPMTISNVTATTAPQTVCNYFSSGGTASDLNRGYQCSITYQCPQYARGDIGHVAENMIPSEFVRDPTYPARNRFGQRASGGEYDCGDYVNGFSVLTAVRPIDSYIVCEYPTIKSENRQRTVQRVQCAQPVQEGGN